MIRAHGSISSDIQAKAKDDKDHNVPDAYSNFARVFDAQAFNELPPHREWDHKIDLRPGWEADRKLKGKTYALDPTEISELNKFIDENLATGRIRESKQGDSPIAAPFFFVKKKDGALRPVQDYRRINSWTIKDVWPLPLISEVMTKIKDAKVFSKMDVRWGFNNVRLREGDEFKAAFTTHRGTFEPTVMFFGLTNSPATFQRMMDHIFAELIGQGKIIVYMDDILVFSATLEEHRQTVNKVLEILHKHDLFLKPEKCQFEKPSMDFLGMVVGNGELRMDPVKTEAVAKWPTPKNLTEVRSFMQFCNFYRSFIPSFATITVPFNELTKKDVKFVWAARQQSAFDTLKAAIADQVVLMLPVPGAKFRLETDASDYAAGAVLHQIVEGRPRPLAFFSKTFDDAQRNYQIYDKELLAVMLGLEHWRHFLRNAPQFEIWTDHKNLEYFREPQKLNRRQARWMSDLADYDFKLHHRPGRLNIVADLLSRKDQPEGGVKDNEDVIVLPPSRFPDAQINRLALSDDVTLLDDTRFSVMAPFELTGRQRVHQSPHDPRRRRHHGFDQGLVKQRRATVEKELRKENPAFKRLPSGIVTFNNQIYVPINKKLRTDITIAHHDGILAGHRGQHATVDLVKKAYWWPGMRGDISRYVSACPVCMRAKPQSKVLATTLSPHDAPPEPWHTISLDLVGPLPLSNGYDTVLTIVDKLTKYTYFIPVSKDINSQGIAQIYVDRIFNDRGIPEKIISDRGMQFADGFMTELCKQLQIKRNASTAFHPQTDGQSEIRNAHLETLLRMWVNQRQDDWAKWLPFAASALNNVKSEATGESPFFLNNGRDPNLRYMARRAYKNETGAELAARMKRAWEDAQAALRQTNERMITQAAKRHRPAPQFKVGDRVWLDRQHLKTLEPTAKLDDKNIGPFFIRAKSGSSSYPIVDDGTIQAHPRHVPRDAPPALRRTRGRTPEGPTAAKRVHLPSRPDEEHWEVEAILDVRKAGPLGVKFLVSYVDQPVERNEWIISGDIVPFAPDLVNAFYRDPAHADLHQIPSSSRLLRAHPRPSSCLPSCSGPRRSTSHCHAVTSPSIAAATLASSGTRALSAVTPKPKNNKTPVVVPPDIASDNDYDPFTSPRPMSPLTTGIDYSIPGPDDIREAMCYRKHVTFMTHDPA